jgi:hypothetical protein
MTELNDIQVRILRALTFVEPFDTLVEEIPYPEPVIGAELKTLIAQRFVQPMQADKKTGAYQRSFVFDSDNMRAFLYIATSQGIDLL